MKTLLSSKTIRQILGVFILLMSLTSVGCTDNIDPTPPSLKIRVDTLLFATAGGTQDVHFDTNRDWVIEKMDNSDWMEISTTGGTAGNGVFTVKVDPSSPDADARVSRIQLNASAQGAVITVIQSGIPIITTGDVAAKDESSALLYGKWIYALKINLAECGIAYSTDGTTYTHVDSGERENSSYEVLLEDLAEQTTYEYKAYIKTDEGVYYYGEVKSFTTDPKSELITVSELRGMSGAIDQYVKIEAIVLNDTVNQNYPNRPHIQVVDRANPDQPNQGIYITLNNVTQYQYNKGDIIEVKLYGASKVTVNNLATKGITVEPLMIKKIGSTTVTPVKIDHTQMKDYESMYVEVENTQLTKAYLSPILYPTWNGTDHPYGDTTYLMEVEGSDETYGLFVNKTASFANESVKTGSGTAKGIVGHTEGDLLTIWPNNADDLSLLTGTRFQTLLELKFTSTVFTGDLTVDNAADAKCIVSVYYQNAEEGETIAGPVSVELSGVGADGLTISDKTDIVLDSRSKSLTFQVRGTPTTVGNITFTVKGLEAYGLTGDAAITTGKVSSGIPEGNFSASWVPRSSDNTSLAASPALALTTNNSPLITLSELIGVGFIPGATASYKTCWGGGGFNNNGLANPSTYAEFTISTGTATLSLYSIAIALKRDNIGYKLCTVQYKINGGSFATLCAFEPTQNTQSFPAKNISTTSDIQNIPPGTIVTIRLVPTGSTEATGRWGISGSGLVITGDVQ